MTAGRAGVMSKPAAAAGGPQTVSLRPDGVVIDTASWANTGGAGSKHAALADDSDATYLLQDDYSADLIIFDFGTFAFGGASINSVTLRIRFSGDLGSDTSDTVNFQQALAGPLFTTADTTGASPSPTTYTGATLTTKPGGGAWTQAAVDGLQCRIAPASQSDVLNDMRVYALYADVVYTP